MHRFIAIDVRALVCRLSNNFVMTAEKDLMFVFNLLLSVKQRRYSRWNQISSRQLITSRRALLHALVDKLAGCLAVTRVLKNGNAFFVLFCRRQHFF